MLTTDEVVEYILNKAATSTPFSILRFGDGEGIYTFHGWGDDKLVEKTYMAHFGSLATDTEKKVMSGNIMKSFMECDIAGMPYTELGFSGDWHKTFESFIGVKRPGKTCSINIHIDMNNADAYHDIIRSRPVFYLGSRKIDSHVLSMGAKSFESITTTPEFHFEPIKPKHQLFRQVEGIEKSLLKMDFNGVICLLACGAAGKHLGNLMRDRGGMVIDIGSVADLWAGVQTRTWIRKYKKPC